MAKISDLPIKAAPSGAETVLVLDAGVAKRAPIGPLVAAAGAPVIAAASGSADRAEAAALLAGNISTYMSEIDSPIYAGAVQGTNGSVAIGIGQDLAVTMDSVNARKINGLPTFGLLLRQTAFDTPGLHFVPFIGQSKQEGSGGGGRFNTTALYGMRAFPKKANPATLDYPLLDTTQIVNGTTNYGGETVGKGGPMHGMRYIGELAEKRDGVLLDQALIQIFVANNGKGATPLSVSMPAGENGLATLSQTWRGRERAFELGLPFVCEAVSMSQGEGGTGQGGEAGYVYANYKNAFKGTAAGFEIAIRNIAGAPLGTPVGAPLAIANLMNAPNPVSMMFTQTNTPTKGGAPIANEDFPVARAQLDSYLDFTAISAPTVITTTNAASASNANPPVIMVPANVGIVPGMFAIGAGISANVTVISTVTAGGTTTVTLSAPNGPIAANTVVAFLFGRAIAVTPEYMVGAWVDGLHYPSREAYWLGAYHALAYTRLVIERVGWTPLTLALGRIVGKFVYLRAIGAEGQLVLDRREPATPDAHMPPQDDPAQGMISGFTARRRSDGSINRVVSVIAAGNYVRVELADAPAGCDVRYALNQAVNRGPYQGGCGNLRDSLGDRLPMYEGNGIWRKMHKWAFAQAWSIPV